MQSRFTLLVYVAIWYASSAVCNTFGKRILYQYNAPLPLWMTLCQFLTTVCVLHVYLFFWKKTPPPSAEDGARKVLYRLAAVYTLGFVFVNCGYLVVTVSLAETLRSAEPLFSVLCTKLMLREEYVSITTVLTLMPIVLGGVLSSGSDTSFTFMGLAFVSCSNVCFALRSVFTKYLKQSYSGNAVQVFYEISKLGLVALFLMCCCVEGLILAAVLASDNGSTQLLEYSISNLDVQEQAMNPGFLSLVIVNGLAYAAYNQMSFLVLSLSTVVTHAVGNSLRRVVTILFSVWVFGNPVLPQNMIGIALSVLGVVAYSVSKARDDSLQTNLFSLTHL